MPLPTAQKQEHWAKYYEENREELLEKSRKYKLENRDRILARRRELYQKNKKHNVERVRTWRAANPDKKQTIEHGRINRAKNKDKRRLHQANRRAAKLNATPSWLTEDHAEEIKDIYTEASGFSLTVDHIIPLKGELVCGLHVPWNLQLLTRSENSAKGNRIL